MSVGRHNTLLRSAAAGRTEEEEEENLFKADAGGGRRKVKGTARRAARPGERASALRVLEAAPRSSSFMNSCIHAQIKSRIQFLETRVWRSFDSQFICKIKRVHETSITSNPNSNCNQIGARSKRKIKLLRWSCAPSLPPFLPPSLPPWPSEIAII